MAKKGMKRYEPEHRKNDMPPVPQIQGKARSGKVNARPLIAGEKGTEGKVYHAVPHETQIPSVYSAIDNDLAIENLENDFDMTAADLQDFRRGRS